MITIVKAALILLLPPLAATSWLAAVCFRYAPLPQSEPTSEFARVWDRFGHRVCLIPDPRLSKLSGVLCTQADLNDWRDLNKFADKKECERIRRVAIDAGADAAAVDDYLRHVGERLMARGITPDDVKGCPMIEKP
jgi:hypothetical protein